MKEEAHTDARSGTDALAIQALVRTGREKFVCEHALEHQRFDAMTWDLRGFKDRPTAQGYGLLYFTLYGTKDQALPPDYAEVVKSWVILERQSISNMVHRVEAARVLWEAILRRRGLDPAAFRWQDLCEEDLSQTELLMQEYWTSGTTYKQCGRLLVMIRFLSARNVCRPLYYGVQTPRPEDFHRHTIAGQEERRAKLPSRRALEGIADIYRIHAKDPVDRLRICALAILVVTGFRMGELLTLPLECEVTERADGQVRYGLRYYREKARGAKRMLDVRWLTATGTELMQKVIPEIREITAPARERAKILEQNPHHVPIPGYGWADRMDLDAVANVLGIKYRANVLLIPQDRLPRYRGADGIFFYAGEVAAYLRSERVERLWTLDRRDGTYQMLSETLLIAFSRGFQATYLTRPLLVEPMNLHHLSEFLVSRGRRSSTFERFGIREENGAFCRMTSHQFRHWLNDLADKGGLPVDLQTRWMGRETLQDTPAYQHATVEERLQWIKNGIRNGEICGTIASAYFALPEDERDIFLEGHIQAVHFTPLGLCIHDFAIDPCPYFLNCTKGCSDYLRTKGNQQERLHLIQVHQRTRKALEIAQAQAAAGNGETAQAWIEQYEETLAGVETALAVDDDPIINDGTVVQPFTNHPSRFQPL